MTDPNIPVTEDELHAYVDNELPAERRGDVEAWLATHPDDAALHDALEILLANYAENTSRERQELVPHILEITRQATEHEVDRFADVLARTIGTS